MKISESYFNVQGEGITQGVSAYFIRLTGCNLMCGGNSGNLVEKGKASWRCDTEAVWKKGKTVTNKELLSLFNQEGILERILSGEVHIIWTGGEPLLQQKGIKGFLDHINNQFNPNKVYSEIETNGTIIAESKFYGGTIMQVNCSPKLSNSGMPLDKVIIPQALRQIAKYENSWFKFVINNESDIKEMEQNFISTFEIQKRRIILMPAVDNLRDLPEKTRLCYEMTKKYGYRTITRGHILAWGRTTGV